MKIGEVLNDAEKLLLNSNIENSFYEARILLEYVLDKSKEWIMIHIEDEIDIESEKQYNELLQRRKNGFPLQYILGKCAFFGNEFFVSDAVLIPRADTEVWVEKVIKIANDRMCTNILDLCTGSGCIAISLKKALKNVSIVASDISGAALDMARKNAEHNNVEIKFFQSDLFERLDGMKFDIIVSNPPYIPNNDIEDLSKEVKNEPYMALSGGEDGLDFYRNISANANSFLNDRGLLVFEFGYNQLEQVKKILKDNNFEILDIIKDYSGNIRAIISEKEINNE